LMTVKKMSIFNPVPLCCLYSVIVISAKKLKLKMASLKKKKIKSYNCKTEK
jgi:hypothetical protein